MGYQRASVVTIILLTIYLFSCQSNPYRQGEWLYKDRCANCHMEDGSGLGAQIPALSESVILVDDQASAICLIYSGRAAKDTKAKQLEMPPNKDLTSADLANLVNYINSKWHPKATVVQDNDIDIWLKGCKN